MRFTFWVCHCCKRTNPRLYEGLDACDGCGSEVATAFTLGARMVVKWQREPDRGQQIENYMLAKHPDVI